MSNIDNKQNPESVTTDTSDKAFEQTYAVTEDITQEPTIDIAQAAFEICEADFLRISNRFQDFGSWVLVIFSASIGATIMLLAKLFQVYVIASSLKIEIYEWVAPLVGLIVSLVLYITCRFLPTEKKKVMNEMKTHFAKAPRKKQLGKK